MRWGQLPLGLIALTLCLAPLRADDPGAALQRAEQQIQEGNYELAERQFRELTRLYPGLAEAYSGLATALTELGREGEASALLLEAGQGLVQTQELELGSEYLRRAAVLTPGSAPVRAALGFAHLQAQRYQEAISDLTAAIELGAREPLVRLYLASASWEAGHFSSAEQIYRQLLADEGAAGVAARRSLGALLLFQGDAERALPILMTAVGEDPTAAMLRFDLARAFDEVGRDVEARELLTRLLQDEPDFFQAHYRLARSYRKAGKIDLATEHLERFRQMHAESQARTRAAGLDEARLLRGWELIRNAEFDAAERHFAALPVSADSLRGLAEAQFQGGKIDQAIANLRRILRDDPERSDVTLLIDRWQLTGAAR